MDSSDSNYDVEIEEWDASLDCLQTAPRPPAEVPCEFITGPAGTGKTFAQVAAIRADPSYGILSATTGIASVNLGAITVHSLLRYSTTEVLRDALIRGRLQSVLHSLARRYRRLIIDEISMGVAEQADYWYRGVQEANRYEDVPEPMGLTFVGDFAQLSPVKARWVFEADCWDKFAANTTRLTKVWRQDGGAFLDALNLVRRGEGAAAGEMLTAAGARWETQLDTEFDGTTILPRNQQVSMFNQIALDRVRGEKFRVTSRRWGRQQPEWGQSKTGEWGIPPEMELKVGAYVMILANSPGFEYANGDCGWITGREDDEIGIKLARTGGEIRLPRIVRGVEFNDRPDGFAGDKIPKGEDCGAYIPRMHFRGKARRWVMGQVEYFPLRLAYASTVHKTQSLTLDRVQVDFRDHFFGQPAMVYVALSRARTLEGLRLVGQREVFAGKCKVDPRVREWI